MKDEFLITCNDSANDCLMEAVRVLADTFEFAGVDSEGRRTLRVVCRHEHAAAVGYLLTYSQTVENYQR